ncbi:DUF6976 family protein [Paludibaculum fermentans]|uniref:Uncharacterized protein n=1 Tax=Paludibaculum fermentans TaxID=1473598 RepID=A0A7S7SKY4_PALFE|nr:hypothetical protein [Paludibaculum fermentans]QOY88824.1 hypothetical protein IRI77_02360 [Paludibaculum fermentans]
MLQTIAEVSEEIRQGTPLLLAGNEQALRALPQGDWIGGTTAYFMELEGGVCSRDRVFVTRVPACAKGARIVSHSAESLPRLLEDAADNGYTVLILPSGSAVHAGYARGAAHYPGMFVKPVVGWVSGSSLDGAARLSPKVIDGRTGECSEDRAVAMHIDLPPGKLAELDIVNVFRPGTGAGLRFPHTGFQTNSCVVGGETVPFAQYLDSRHADMRLPLTADYNGSIVNVSIESVDTQTGMVKFFAPVFEGVEYKLAAPVPGYSHAFDGLLEDRGETAFACNCVLNYLYCHLEGRAAGTITGPVTYGEIANMLLNQTLVRLFIRG